MVPRIELFNHERLTIDGIERQCTECGEWFPSDRDFFYKGKRHARGLLNICIACFKEKYGRNDKMDFRWDLVICPDVLRTSVIAMQSSTQFVSSQTLEASLNYIRYGARW